MLTKPPIKKVRGSYFPPLPPTSGYGFTVMDVQGEIIYEGYNETVARLVAACMTPRVA